MFSDFEILILCLMPNKIDLVLFHQNEFLIYYYLQTSHKAY